MKNIVFVAHGLSLGGIDVFVTNVLEHLNKEKYNISLLLALDEDSFAPLEERVKSYGINVVHICDLDSISKKIYYFKTLYSLFKKNKYDVVHANMDLLSGVVVTLAKLAGIPIRICHAHTSNSKYRTNAIKAFIQNIYHKTMRTLMRLFATDHLACSDEASKYFFGKTKSQLIYNGIDTEKFSQNNHTTSEKKQIVTVARCTEVKNPFFALEVISKLKETRNDFTYKWVGNGDLLEVSKQKATELNISDIVEFTGPRPDVPEILSSCDIFFLPSLFEGLPISLIEAQFAGLKCLTSDAVTTLSNLGRTVYLPLSSGTKKWAETLSIILDQEVTPLNEEKAQLFDIKYTVKQLEKIYDK